MKKKVSVVVTAAALVALIVVGSTLAFFTSQGTVDNVGTMGNVKISLTEPNDKDSGIVVPGQTIVKDPTVKNTGSNTAYIRCKIDITGLDGGNEDITMTRKAQLLNGIVFGSPADSRSPAVSRSAAEWVPAGDGYYYYQEKLASSESVVFFSSVKIPESWDNDLADKKFHINVTAEAIQADNFEPSRDAGTNNINGWNYSNGTPIPVSSPK